MAFISSYVPNSAHYGEWVEINGSDFLAVTDVLGFATYGDDPPPYQDIVPALDWEIVNDTLIRVRVPAVAEINNAGVGVILEVPGGNYTHTGFTYLGVLPGTLPPTINSLNPIAAVPGQKVTITGEGFTGATSVKFGTAEAIFFRIVSDFIIEAYPNFTGTNIVTVTTPIDSDTKDGFTLLISQIRLVDLPPLGRDATDDDLVYVWDIVRAMLCQSTRGQLTAGLTGGGGGGGGDTGNIYTALGSPFKVRDYSDNYAYDEDENSVTIQDIRLIGKSDYVVSATDVSNEFEDYDNTSGSGNLEYDETAGSVIIHNYKLTPGSHITIYADGVVSTALQTYLVSVKAQIDSYEKVLKPVLTTGGTVWPWRKAANLIPAGWQECTDFRGKIPIGQNPTDVYNSTTNPLGLSQPVGTALGAKEITLTPEYIPVLQTEQIFENSAGNSLPSAYKAAPTGANKRKVNVNEKAPGVGTKSTPTLSPVRIVNWIEYLG